MKLILELRTYRMASRRANDSATSPYYIMGEKYPYCFWEMLSVHEPPDADESKYEWVSLSRQR